MNNDKPPPRVVLSLAQLQAPLCCLEIGFGGHVVAVGDVLGNFVVYQSVLFGKYCGMEKIETGSFSNVDCYNLYVQDRLWSTQIS